MYNVISHHYCRPSEDKGKGFIIFCLGVFSGKKGKKKKISGMIKPRTFSSLPSSFLIFPSSLLSPKLPNQSNIQYFHLESIGQNYLKSKDNIKCFDKFSSKQDYLF